MGLFEWANDCADDVSDTIEGLVENGGDLVEGFNRLVAKGADAVGLDPVRDLFNASATAVANATGAEVDELELGQTRDPKALIIGEPSSIEDKSGKVRSIGESLGSTGTALSAIDVSGWQGRGADAFRALWSQEPGYWDDAHEAFTSAADAMTTFAGQLTSAQEKAQTAIDKWDEAERKQEEYDALDDSEKATSTLDVEAAQLRSEAQGYLDDGRRLRDESVGTFSSAMNAARDLAPEEPPFVNRLVMNGVDLGDLGQQYQTSFIDGFLTGATETIAFVRSLDPNDSYNRSHPAEYQSRMDDLYTGLVVAVADPGAVVTQVWEEVKEDPARAAGGATFEIATALVTGGSSTLGKASSRVAREASEIGSIHPPGTPGRSGSPAGPRNAHGHAQPTPHDHQGQHGAGSERVSGQGPGPASAPPGGQASSGGNRPAAPPMASRGGEGGRATDPHSGSETAPHSENSSPEADGVSAANESHSANKSNPPGPDARPHDQPARTPEAERPRSEHDADGRSSEGGTRNNSISSPRAETPPRIDTQRSDVGNSPEVEADSPRSTSHGAPEGRDHGSGDTRGHERSDSRTDDHRPSGNSSPETEKGSGRPRGTTNPGSPRATGVTHALDDFLYRIGPEDGVGLEPSDVRSLPDSDHGNTALNDGHPSEGARSEPDGGRIDDHGDDVRPARTGDELFHEIFRNFTVNLKGRFGEFLTRAWLELNGYTIVAEGPRLTVDVNGQTVVTRPDFLAIDRNGELVAVESKLGPSAGFTPNQKLAFPELADGATFSAPAKSELVRNLIEENFIPPVTSGKVDLALSEVRLMDWNELRPSKDLVRLAGELAGEDTVRKLPSKVAEGIRNYLGFG